MGILLSMTRMKIVTVAPVFTSVALHKKNSILISKYQKQRRFFLCLKELKKNKMSVVATGILFGVMGVLIIPMIAVIVKISNALSQKHPRIYKYSMIAFIGMLLAISLFCVVIKHQMSFLVIVACLAITLCDTIKNR